MAKYLYHGTNALFDYPQINFENNIKDFGFRYYLTDDLNTAKNRAREKFIRFGGGKYVYSYDFEVLKLLQRNNMKLHRFNGDSLEWIKFIIACRTATNESFLDCDVIIGLTADARAQELVNKYIVNSKDLNDASNLRKLIENLRVYVYGTQYCFRTLRSLHTLQSCFKERRCI